MIEWMVGFCVLMLLTAGIRRRSGKAAGIFAAAAALMAIVSAAVFLFIKGQDALSGGPAPDDAVQEAALSEAAVQKAALSELLLPDISLNTAAGDFTDEAGLKPERQPGVRNVFGYSDYTGYLDECVQWLGYEDFVKCDYDGDGITDRVWRENIQDGSVADYRIEFGNGDLIEIPKTAGGTPQVRSLDLEGDGVREILFTETFSYSADTGAYGQMALFRQTEKGYEMMELPGGMSQVDSEEYAPDGTMIRYQPSLSFCYEAAGEYNMRVTCPEAEKAEGARLLDVVADFTQEAWEMGNYRERYVGGSSEIVPCEVEIVSVEDGRDGLQLYFGMLDEWCDDRTVMTLAWEKDSLHIRDIRYWHNYVETAYADIGGQVYELIIRGYGYVGEEQYTIDTVQVVCSKYDEKFKGMVEEHVQYIDPGEAAEQYWGEGYAFGDGIPDKAVSSSRNGNILVRDLNFDGNEDFCIQGWITAGSNIPYYCYFWNEDTGQFEYGACIPNVDVDEDLERIRSVVYEGDGVYCTRYYKYESGMLVMERCVKVDASPDVVLDRLDLTYVETSYSMDRNDYVKAAPRLFDLAEQALAELYQMTGTKVEVSCFTVSEFGDFSFALKAAELKGSKFYYSRCYGAQEGFTDCITSIIVSDEYGACAPEDSPLEYRVAPPDQDYMSDEEIVQWHFENSPFARVSRWKFGNAVLKVKERVRTIEETFEGNYIIGTELGNYYELTYEKDEKRVIAYYGPYESYPVH